VLVVQAERLVVQELMEAVLVVTLVLQVLAVAAEVIVESLEHLLIKLTH
jgi:hypothetical protein